MDGLRERMRGVATFNADFRGVKIGDSFRPSGEVMDT
jgi:hypothetical protein